MASAARDLGARRLDEVAVVAALRRLRRQTEAPWLHREVARRLVERLVPLRIRPRRVLDWWASAGGTAAALRGRFAAAAVVPVEPGEAADVDRPGDGRWSRLFGRGKIASLRSEADNTSLGPAQVVCANMMLHFVADPPALIARWHELLDDEGVLAFSCPGPGTLRELRELYAACGWPAPTPGYVDMHDLGDMMVGAGFADPVLDQETIQVRWADAGKLLGELAQLGGNTAPERVAGLRTPRWRARLLDALRERAEPDGRIGLSFEIAYGHGFKVAPRTRPDASTSVPLETMRDLARRPRR